MDKFSLQLNHIDEYMGKSECGDRRERKSVTIQNGQNMERQVISIQEESVIYAPHHGEVWMKAWEIAELFYVSGVTVRNAIKRIWKQGTLKEFETYRYIKLDIS